MIESLSRYGGGYQEPDTIIIHSMGEYILDPEPVHAEAFLKKYHLSAHALIAPDGEVYLCRSPYEGAWHARGYNKNTLGIEFLVEGEHTYASFLRAIKSPYLTDNQLTAGIDLCKDWLNRYDIKKITRHSDVSPGRKVDPGKGFPWTFFLSQLGESSE